MNSYSLNVLLIGDRCTGKTSMVNKQLTGEFCTEYKPTYEINELTLSFNTTFGKIVMNILDYSMSNLYTLNSNIDAAIILFDSTQKTIITIENYITDVIKIYGNIPIVICANKCDLKNTMNQTELSSIAKLLKYPFFSISTKTGCNLEKPFLSIMRQCLNSNIFITDKSISKKEIQRNNKHKFTEDDISDLIYGDHPSCINNKNTLIDIYENTSVSELIEDVNCVIM